MNRCDFCGQEHILGTLFCSECAAPLAAGNGYDSLAQVPAYESLHILIAASRRQVQFHLNGPLWIGRADPDAGFWPQLDLTPDNGAFLGVSRRHAVIDVTDRGPVLIDKNSINGTWLEDERLAPQRPYVLPATARVRFGRLETRIVLE